MKFKCHSSQLQKAIQMVERIVAQRNTLPIMENIYFELNNGVLTLRGNDLEVGIETKIKPDEATRDGKVLIKGKTIASIVSKINTQNIEVSVDENQKVIIHSDSVDFDIHGGAVTDYPVFPSVESGTSFSLPAEQLRLLIRYTIFSVSFEETKQFLNGILMDYENGVLNFVSTDGYRLSLRKYAQEAAAAPFSVIVPYKAMNEMSKILNGVENDKSIILNVSNQQVTFKMDDFVMITRIIQGKFPDYKKVFPTSADNSYQVNRRELLEAAERASIIASSSNNVVRLYFENGHLEIKAQASKLGEFKESLPVKVVKGQGDTRIAFNVRLLVDALKNSEMEELLVEFNNELSPCLIKAVEGNEFVYVIMPIRTGEYTEKATEEEVAQAV